MIRRMRSVCCVTKARIEKHTKNMLTIVAFPRQQFLGERVLILRCLSLCLFLFVNATILPPCNALSMYVAENRVLQLLQNQSTVEGRCK